MFKNVLTSTEKESKEQENKQRHTKFDLNIQIYLQCL